MTKRRRIGAPLQGITVSDDPLSALVVAPAPVDAVPSRKPRGKFSEPAAKPRQRAADKPPCPLNCLRGCTACMGDLTPRQEINLLQYFRAFKQELERLRSTPPIVGETLLFKRRWDGEDKPSSAREAMVLASNQDGTCVPCYLQSLRPFT